MFSLQAQGIIRQLLSFAPSVQARFLYHAHPELWICGAEPRFLDRIWEEIKALQAHETTGISPDTAGALITAEPLLREALLKSGYQFLEEVTGSVAHPQASRLWTHRRLDIRAPYGPFRWHHLEMTLSEAIHVRPIRCLLSVMDQYPRVRFFVKRPSGKLIKLERSAIAIYHLMLEEGETVEWVLEGEGGEVALNTLWLYNKNGWRLEEEPTQAIVTITRAEAAAPEGAREAIRRATGAISALLSGVFHVQRGILVVGSTLRSHDEIKKAGFEGVPTDGEVVHLLIQAADDSLLMMISPPKLGPQVKGAQEALEAWLGPEVFAATAAHLAASIRASERAYAAAEGSAPPPDKPGSS